MTDTLTIRIEGQNFKVTHYNYGAPALAVSEAIGLDIHDNWGLHNHHVLQSIMLPTGSCRDGYNNDLVEALCALEPRSSSYHGFDRYHIAMGMISQFNWDDITYFLDVPYGQRDAELLRTINDLQNWLGVRFEWVPSKATVDKILDELHKDTGQMA